MKKILLLLIMIGLVSCKDRQPDPNVLPDATQTGANTGGALVDGMVWVAKVTNPDLYGGGVNATMYEIGSQYKLQISLGHVKDFDGNKIIINIVNDNDFATGEFTLDQTNVARYSPPNSPYYTDEVNTGKITITRFDKINKIICGTFSFKAKNSSEEIVTITEGRFDKKFL